MGAAGTRPSLRPLFERAVRWNNSDAIRAAGMRFHVREENSLCRPGQASAGTTELVARMERSEIRDRSPDCASLHPGYAALTMRFSHVVPANAGTHKYRRMV